MRSIYSLLFFAALFFSANTLFSQTVVWSEEFDGGPNGWTTVSITPNDTSLWNWDPTGDVSEAALVSGTLNSATNSNGTMEFNADFYTTGGDPDNVPSGPPETYPKYIAELISPTIDLSSVTTGLEIQFTQLILFLNVSPGAPGNFRASMQYSIDDGLTWSDPSDCVPSSEGYEINTLYNNDTRVIPLFGVEGESQVKIKFTFSSDFYVWVIDDILLQERPKNDLRLANDFQATLPNYQWPISMVEPVGFVTDIENAGGNDLSNVTASITITNDDTATDVYSAELDYGTVEAGMQSIDQIIPGYYVPDATGNYTGTYEVSSDSTDVTPNNNTSSFNFIITDSLFAKESEATGVTNLPAGNWDADEARSWAYGNYYYVPVAQDQYIRYVQFGINGAGNGGEILSIKVYSWSDNNADELAQPDERLALGALLYEIQGTESALNLITLEMTDPLGDPIALEDDTEYLVMVEYQTESTTETVNFPFSQETDFRAMVWRTQQDGEPRYASFLATAGDLETAEYTSLGFGYDVVARARISIGDPIMPNQTSSILDVANLTKVFPNPASDQLTLDLQFEEMMDEVRIDIYDVSGRIYQTRFLDQVQNQQVDFNVSSLLPGNYMMHISTDKGTRTEHFNVIR